jgi:catechol 2,3-dioxygenase-like lactoylglutathione lyase family enzyme
VTTSYQRAAPVLQVADVAASLRWYKDVLGFAADVWPDNPPYTFAILRRDGAEIMLRSGVSLARVHVLRPGGEAPAGAQVRVREE